MNHLVTSPSDLERGDHIRRRLKGFVGADHHGIYLGCNMVAHFAAPPDAIDRKAVKSEGYIRKDNYYTFADNEMVFRVPHFNPKVSKEDAARFAEACVSAEIWKGEYDLFS